MNFTFKISVYSGDIIYTLPGIKTTCERAGVKAEIYVWLNRPWGDSIEGQRHPYGVSEYALNMMRPLLEAQSYIASVKEWKGEKIAVDLDQLRTDKISTMPRGSITTWPFQIWPDMHTDTSRPWINIDEHVDKSPDLNMEGSILVNRTARWRNDMIHYYFLREIKEHLVFTGLPEEHEDFCRAWDLQIPLLKVQNFLELAIAIRTCRMFIGNQSLCFALAEAMKVPRILEICPYAPNVVPSGPDAYQFLHQTAFEWLVKDLKEKL